MESPLEHVALGGDRSGDGFLMGREGGVERLVEEFIVLVLKLPGLLLPVKQDLPDRFRHLPAPTLGSASGPQHAVP